MIQHYDWAGGREAITCFGPEHGPVVLVALPPFEEANRTRTFVATLLRSLANQHIGGAIPDLPGTGESLIATEDATLADWRGAFAAAADSFRGRQVHGASLRGGALIDAHARLASRWQFAPQAGDLLVRELIRTRAMSGEGKVEIDLADDRDDGLPVELAGNCISRAMLRQLNSAKPTTGSPLRVVRLSTEIAPADLKVEAAPLWRRAEPDNDPQLADTLAADLAAWVRTCAA